ncbi:MULTISPECIES: hypothetical protein [Lentilactobacillus]|uniref:Uncharacterized protein n=2 Tax=Lentilactobacillus diolivorans TaxID=179838 RepID=A0A0R1S9S9_9LACO|nr:MULTISPECIES: hypothetical protein [Lentilactobacillus]KRL63394.1 hypothetical protein FC85_GL001609 [Lentilactobacillus diolivorans DSM 14421]MCP9334472.1 hypothetical protein [Lentilactobacillus hilgardii]MCP9351069.1 hypothetical protein [Lentilactobacillus hilgardii]MCP9353910.1 hypothetical protein [Lentilactobacillus hilgardii]MCT3397837.1 hypothetical protein [Lentilactobacillus hilgardii]
MNLYLQKYPNKPVPSIPSEQPIKDPPHKTTAPPEQPNTHPEKVYPKIAPEHFPKRKHPKQDQ